MRHLDSRYGTNPAIVPGAIQKNTNDPSTAPTVLFTPLLPHHVTVFAERLGAERPARARLSLRHPLMPGRSSGLLGGSGTTPLQSKAGPQRLFKLGSVPRPEQDLWQLRTTMV